MAGSLSPTCQQSKRKRQSMTNEDFEYERAKQARVQSPRLDRRATFPCENPGLMLDSSSATNSDSEQDHTMEVDMDGDMDMDMDSQVTLRTDPRIVSMDDSNNHRTDGYSFGQGGTGGFGFGPGAEEDEEDMDLNSYPALKVYPSLTAHTNPNHFSNLPSSTASYPGRPKSPFFAQPFSTTLRAPSPARGLMQPTINSSLSASASDVEKARTAHGPNCKRIPKLVLSDYPDPSTGQRSMWTMCEDCGAVERAG